jgi:hypothetical protein
MGNEEYQQQYGEPGSGPSGDLNSPGGGAFDNGPAGDGEYYDDEPYYEDDDYETGYPGGGRGGGGGGEAMSILSIIRFSAPTCASLLFRRGRRRWRRLV